MFIFIFSCSQLKQKNIPNIELYPLDKLEGLSGLWIDSQTKEQLIFWSHTDRGANAQEIIEGGQVKRPFVNPSFRPYWVKFSLNRKTGEVKTLKKIELNLSGLPNSQEDEVPVNLKGQLLKRDAMGIDPESICFDGKHVWMGEEYGPSILKFTKKGKLLKRYLPGVLPQKLRQRRLNRGLEGLACANNKIYAILQSPLPNDGNKILLIEFNPITEKTEREFYYPLESSKADKIGDMAFKNNYFYVIEQNGEIGANSFHRIYKFNLINAMNNSILNKEFVADLVEAGFDFAEKIEGLAVLDNNELSIVNDNDFGLNSEMGKIVIDPSRKTILGILKFKN